MPDAYTVTVTLTQQRAGHAGGHITPRQAGFALVPGDGRGPEGRPTGADGYARSVVANFLA